LLLNYRYNDGKSWNSTPAFFIFSFQERIHNQA